MKIVRIIFERQVIKVETTDKSNVGQKIISVISKEVEKTKNLSQAEIINYDDHCEWHDAGTGDCTCDRT